jgi:hypothetical protein
MKKRTLLSIALLFVAGNMLLLMNVRRHREPARHMQSFVTNNLSRSTNPKSSKLFNSRLELRKEEHKRQDAIRRVRNEWKVPINFYGKVVDEEGVPVSDAKILFGWNNLYGSPEKSVKSAYDGSFSLEREEGKVLEVKVTKEGYYSSKSNPPHFFTPEKE